MEKNEGFWGFENLTQCPYDRKLIDVELLTKPHIDFINNYHQKVLETLTPELIAYNDQDALQWLQRNCEPLML